MTYSQKTIAIQLAILHALIIPASLFIFLNLQFSLLWIGTLIFLHHARMNFDYSEFNKAKTYWFMLIAKITFLLVITYLSKEELLDMIALLIAFYS